MQQSFWLACCLHFPHDLARVVHNTDAGLLDRHVQSSKMLHAALSLILEAVTTDLVSPSVRSAAPKIFSYPQAELPQLCATSGHSTTDKLLLKTYTVDSDAGGKQIRLISPDRGEPVRQLDESAQYIENIRCFDKLHQNPRITYQRVAGKIQTVEEPAWGGSCSDRK